MQKTRTVGNIKKIETTEIIFHRDYENHCAACHHPGLQSQLEGFLYMMVKSLKSSLILNPDKILPLKSYFVQIMRTTVQKLPPPWPSESVGRLSLLPIFLLQKASKAKEGRAPSAFASALRPMWPDLHVMCIFYTFRLK